MTRRLMSLLAVLAAIPVLAQNTDLAAGIAHYNARRWDEAHAFFANAAKSQPRNADAALWYGKTLLAEDKIRDAEDWFATAATLAPRSSECQLWLARALGIQAQRANVIKQPFIARRVKGALDRAIELDGDNMDAREMRWQFYAQAPGFMGGGDDKARAEAAEIARRNPYRGQFVAINMAARAKDDATVERLFKALVAAYPDSLLPMTQYANRLVDLKRTAEAFAVVDAVQKRRPNDPIVLYQVGRLAAVTGEQLDRGEAALRRYLTLAPPPASNVPTLSNAHFRLGNIEEKRGNVPAARAAYELALRLDGRNEPARRALAGLK